MYTLELYCTNNRNIYKLKTNVTYGSIKRKSVDVPLYCSMLDDISIWKAKECVEGKYFHKQKMECLLV